MRAVDHPQRHDRAWLDVDWSKSLSSTLAPADTAIIEDWTGCGRPLVVARSLADDVPGSIRLGLALPGKRRLGFTVQAQAIARLAAPMLLEEAMRAVPLPWREPLAGLISEFAALGLSLRVFGSLAWHCFVRVGGAERNAGYLTSTSDIDLLVAPLSLSECAGACRVLGEFEIARPAPRLDGEFIFPDGSAASWREYASRPDRILIKRMHEIALLPFARLEPLFARMAA